MLPNIGQGSVQAFEDAYILARWLASHSDNPAEAFQQFRRIRIPRVHAIQRLSSEVARLKHMRDADAQKTLIDAGKGTVPTHMDWVWGFDPVLDWSEHPVVPAIETATSS